MRWIEFVLRSILVGLILSPAGMGSVLGQDIFMGQGPLSNYDHGRILKLDRTEQEWKVHGQMGNSDGFNQDYVELMVAADGGVYGTAYARGANGVGTLFKFDTATRTIQVLYEFSKSGTRNPLAGLWRAGDGKHYFFTMHQQALPVPGNGLMQWDLALGKATVWMDTLRTQHGLSPRVTPILNSNGWNYGTMGQGGSYNAGTLYRIRPGTGQFEVLHDFKPDVHGSNPYYGLLWAQDKRMYGFTVKGGMYDKGVMYLCDTGKNSFKILHHIKDSMGFYYPIGTPYEISPGKLLFMASAGGAHGYGGIVSYDIAGKIFTVEYSFRETHWPQSFQRFQEVRKGVLAGFIKGFSLPDGFYFEYDVAGKDLIKVRANGASGGIVVMSSLTPNGKGRFYVLSSKGGSHDQGTVMEWDSLGNLLASTSLTTQAWRSLFDPLGIPAVNTTGTLYGVAGQGGAYGKGGLWNMRAGKDTLDSLYSFKEHLSPGYFPVKPQMGLDAMIYIPSYNNPFSSNKGGAIIVLDPYNNKVRWLDDLDQKENGWYPVATMTRLENGTWLVPTTAHGGSGYGSLNLYDPIEDRLKPLWHFNYSLGHRPSAGFSQAADGHFYALCQLGGNYGMGSLVRWNSLTGQLQKMLDLNVAQALPTEAYSNLVGYAGKLYGYLYDHGPGRTGRFFEYEPGTNTIKNLFEFGNQSGLNYPVGWLAVDSAGIIYGVARSGNENTIYSYTIGDALPVKHAHKFSELASLGQIAGMVTGRTCPVRYDSIEIIACDTIWSPSGRFAWTDSGTYKDVLTASNGCDSIITVHARVRKGPWTYLMESACNSFEFYGQSLTKSGTYHQVFERPGQCDSVIRLKLEIDTLNTTVQHNGNYLSSRQLFGRYQWVDCGKGYAILSGDTLRDFAPEDSGSYAVIVSNGACMDTTACVKFVKTGIGPEQSLELGLSWKAGPVPFFHDLYVWLQTDQEEELLLELLGMDGRVLAHMASGPVQSGSNLHFAPPALGELPDGPYILRVSGESGSSSRLIFKSRSPGHP